MNVMGASENDANGEVVSPRSRGDLTWAVFEASLLEIEATLLASANERSAATQGALTALRALRSTVPNDDGAIFGGRLLRRIVEDCERCSRPADAQRALRDVRVVSGAVLAQDGLLDQLLTKCMQALAEFGAVTDELLQMHQLAEQAWRELLVDAVERIGTHALQLVVTPDSDQSSRVLAQASGDLTRAASALSLSIEREILRNADGDDIRSLASAISEQLLSSPEVAAQLLESYTVSADVHTVIADLTMIASDALRHLADDNLRQAALSWRNFDDAWPMRSATGAARHEAFRAVHQLATRYEVHAQPTLVDMTTVLDVLSVELGATLVANGVVYPAPRAALEEERASSIVQQVIDNAMQRARGDDLEL